MVVQLPDLFRTNQQTNMIVLLGKLHFQLEVWVREEGGGDGLWVSSFISISCFYDFGPELLCGELVGWSGWLAGCLAKRI